MEVALVEFFAPWCGHCKSLTPEYEKAATALKAHSPPIPLVRVDATVETTLGSKYGVTGYPTLKIFRNGQVASDYGGPRTADGIVQYMKKQSGPSSKELTTVAAVEAFLAGADHAVIGFFKSTAGSQATSFFKMAEANRDDFRIAHSTSPEVLAKYSVEKNSAIYVFQPKNLASKFEEESTLYTGTADATTLKQFIISKITGLAGVMTTDNAKFFRAKSPLVVVYYDLDFTKNPSRAKFIRNRVLKVAKETQGKASFAVASKTVFSSDADKYGGFKGDVTTVIQTAEKKYVMEQEFSPEALTAFVTDFAAGKLEPYIKSEPIPTNDKPVKVVVGKNFEEIVNQPNKDVFLEFYAPWCGHCKSLAPKWDDLAEQLAKEDSVVIAKMDATANDYPAHFPVQGYPSIFWVPADNKNAPKKYDGDRETDAMLKFVKENAKSELKSLATKKKKGGKKAKKSDEL